MKARPTSDGTVLGRYRLVERIGEGGMGEVWKAHDANLDRDVAIKMLCAARSTTRPRASASAARRACCPGSPTRASPRSSTSTPQDGDDFLVMEYVPGGTLESRLGAGPLPLDDVLRLGAAIADALENAHRHGFLHRDLKPGNIVLTDDGQPKILDFGLAVLLAGRQGDRQDDPGRARSSARCRTWRPSSCSARPTTRAPTSMRSA